MNTDRWTDYDDEQLQSWADAYASMQEQGLVPPASDYDLGLLQKVEDEMLRQASQRESAAKVDGFIIGSLVMAAIFVAWRVWA